MAFIAGLIVFPVIFALGLSEQVSNSTIGALFISLPGAFFEMGMVGRVVGFVFFVALVVAGLTSWFSLLEVGTASFMDEFKLPRKTAAVIAGTGAAIAGLFPALSQNTLGVLDKVVGELLVVGGVLGMALFVGWSMDHPESELLEGTSPFFSSTRSRCHVLVALCDSAVHRRSLVVQLQGHGRACLRLTGIDWD